MVRKAEEVVTIQRAVPDDAEAILAEQKRACRSEARLYGDWAIPPLSRSLPPLLDEFGDHVVFKAVRERRIVGSVWAKWRAGT